MVLDIHKKSELSLYVMTACLEVSAVWTETLQGRGDLREALARISALTHADYCGIARCKAAGEKPDQYGAFRQRPDANSRPQGSSCVSFGFFGPGLFLAKEASTWSKVDALSDRSAVRSEPLVDGNGHPLQDIRSIILERDDSGMTILELHFRSAPSNATVTAIKLIAEPLSKSWKRRLPGIAITSAIQAVNGLGRYAEDGAIMPVLSFQNPKGLSRAEFRICMMIHGGMKVTTIADSLHISAKTVRGHLSSIYSKVGVSGQFELLHLLTTESHVEHRKEMSN